MLPIPLIATWAALVFALPAMAAQPQEDVAQGDTLAAAQATPALPLRSHDALAAWRQANPGPLDRMSPTGLARFLRGLVLTDRGPAGFPLADLQAELTSAEVTAVARLFGMDGHWEGLTEAEARRVSQVARPAAATALEHRVETFEADIDDLSAHTGSRNRAMAVQARFEQTFPSAGWTRLLANAGDHNLLLLWRAASSAAFHGRDPRLHDRAATALAALRERGLDTRLQVRDMQALHFAAGDPDAAAAIAQAMPERDPIRLPGLHPLADSGRHHTAWEVTGDPPALVERDRAVAGRRVVVVSAPGCGFSRAAARDIAGDAALGPVFARHALWLAPPRQLAGWEHLQRWNAAHPDTPIEVATREGAWPELDFARTPVFVVLDGDRGLARISGWTPDHRLQLEEALRAHGLLPD